ncbi:MAG TPA: TIR domain-containing protein [Chloroflexaceae bacterium]|nr:TIR domain-containing protein [Chloroflexaceae bacterium]
MDDPNEIAYEFVDGVRELLIEMAPLVHPVEVLDRVATYITEMRGQGEQMLSRVSGLPGSEDRGGSATLPFARINANLLYGLGLTGDTVPAAARDRDPVRSAPVFKEGNAKSLEKIDPQLSQGTADIERQLRDVLPAESHTHIVHIAQLLNNMASGRIDPEVLRERFTAGPEIAALLNQLAGQQFNLGTTIISFMAGNQLGEVSIHEVAEGSVVSYNITPEPTKIRSLSRGRSTAGQNQRKLRVFFSYSSVDRPAVRQLSQLLAEAGVVPWLAEEQLMPGQSLSSELSKEIENSDVVLICLSREAVNQMSLQQEINKALIAIESRPVGEMILIPVLLEPCIVPKQLARWDRVELATPQGMSHLMRALQILAEDIGVLIPHLPTGGEREYSLVTQKEPAPSIGNIELNQLWQQALSASERADWAYAEFLLAQIAAADPVYRDVQSRLTEVRRKIELHTELRALHEANNWAAVLDRLEALDQQQLDYLGTEELRRWALNRRRYEERYRAALEATNEGDWNNAISILEPLLLSFPDDARAMALLELSRQELVKQQADKTEGPYEISASGEASSSVTDGVTLHSRPQFFADVLLITVSDIETEGVRDALAERHGRSFSHTLIGAKIYYDLGVLGGARTFLVRSEMGAGGVGGALLTTATAISDLAPAAIVMLGIAFGLRPQQQALGDILVSRQLMFYDLQRVGSDDAGRLQLRARGDRPAASPWLLDRFRSGRDDWRGAALHFGLILSSDKLVGDQGFREQLLQLEPEAIGGEMEGAGLYAAAQHQRVDWILVKAISDWADGQKAQGKAEQQRQAARNAADFILHVLEQGGMVRQAPRPTAPAASAPAAPPGRLPQLRQLLTDRLGSEELNTLCFDLGIDPEDLPAQSRAGKARELIGYLERRRSIDKLLAWLRQHRPDIDLD